MTSVRILDCEIEGEAGERLRVDVLVSGGRIAQLCAPGALAGDAADDRDEDTARTRATTTTIRAGGGALLPALHDHHIHLFALAAARASVDCSPARVRTREELARAFRTQPAGGPALLRAVGYHESIAGELDRNELDALAPRRAIRVQHRTGALWILNSAALEAAGLAREAPEGGWPHGAELDENGRSNGRFFRLDDWLARQFGRGNSGALSRSAASDRAAPDLSAVSRELAACGVASVTDATPRNDSHSAASFAAAQRSGELLQRIRLMGAAGPRPEFVADSPDASASLEWGERKLVLDERDLPALDDVAAQIAEAHEQRRSVAIHCVTRSELVVAAGALEVAGVRVGDRIEHASIAAPDAVEWLSRLGVAVVTQPGFIAERGDDYLRDVEARDRPWLYRCAGFDAGGVPLGGGTDAPYASADPWAAMRAAVDRKTPTGQVLGTEERVSPERALALFTSPADAPGAAPRRIAEGEIADLVLLDCSWAVAREHLEAAHVRATLAAGRVIESRPS